MISTKGRYALRVMLDLAEHNDGSYIPLKDISVRQELSKKYLEIVVKTLVTEKLIRGHRGKNGGYQLTRTPGEYTVGEIIELAEGNLSPVACLVPGAEPCHRREGCKTYPVWSNFNKMVHDYFYGITLEDILKGEAIVDCQVDLTHFFIQI